MTINRAYSIGNQLMSEQYTGGVPGGILVTNMYDSVSRRTNIGVYIGQGLVYNIGYQYDQAGRLSAVSDTTNTVTYGYLWRSMLVERRQSSWKGAVRLVETNRYDGLNRLTQVQTVNGTGATVTSYTYTYNDANQRVRAGLGSTCWIR